MQKLPEYWLTTLQVYLYFHPQVERRDSKPCVGTVAGQDVGNTGQ